jgi:pilus assembly protein Flp/PilA
LPLKIGPEDVGVTQSTQEHTMRNALIRLVRDESGATAIEYGLIAALIAVAIVAAVTLVGGNLNNVFNNVATRLGNAVGG